MYPFSAHQALFAVVELPDLENMGIAVGIALL